MLDHKDELREDLVKLFPQMPKIEGPKQCMELGQIFVQMKVAVPLERHPEAVDEVKKKWPKKLIPKRDGRVNEKAFMTWLMEKDQKRLSLFLMLVIFAVLLIVLFPIWPVGVKLIIWYISFYLLVTLMTLIVVRAIVWTIFFIFGMDFWIFPNLLEDTYYILDTFKPLYSFAFRKDGARMLLVRLVTLGSVVLGGYQFFQDQANIDNVTEGTQELVDDLFEWGHQKFVVGNVMNN